jgi:uncharacterized protein (TIGR00369 family)
LADTPGELGYDRVVPSAITAAEFVQLVRDGMPHAAAMPYDVVALERGLARVGLSTGGDAVRPGGTIAGPVLFWLADLAMYAAVLSVVGKVPLAVTTDATVHFLRGARPGRLLAVARVLKDGKRLVVGDVVVTQDGAGAGADDAALVHAVMTYSVPPPVTPP